MYQNKTLLMIFMLASFFSSVCSAYQVEGLFNSEVVVSDRSADQRKAGIKRAFENVLLKVSGSRDVVSTPEIIPPDTQLEAFVEQFRYSEIEPTEGSAEQSSASQPGLKLWVGFDANAVLRYLQKANSPIWDKTRPLSLIWLAVQDGPERYLLEPEIHQKTKSFVEQVAGERGLPIAFPLMDLEDRGALTLTDVWGDFSDTIKSASKRYGADAILVARVFHESELTWQARWTLYQGQEINHWENRAETKSAAIAEGIHATADLLGRRYAQVLQTNLELPLTMTVVDITNYEQYAKVINYLGGLSQIASLNLTRISNNNVEFDLLIRGSREGLENVIELGGVMGRAEQDVPPASETNVDPAVIQQSENQEESTQSSVGRGMVYRLRP